jgi:hypothetical protein
LNIAVGLIEFFVIFADGAADGDIGAAKKSVIARPAVPFTGPVAAFNLRKNLQARAAGFEFIACLNLHFYYGIFQQYRFGNISHCTYVIARWREANAVGVVSDA